MKSHLTLALAALLCATAAPAAAQYSYEQQQYERQMREYEAQQRDYEARRRAYEAAQRDYDMRYGAGAYARYYGAPAGSAYDTRYDERYYVGADPYYGARTPYAADAYYEDPYYREYANSPCERRSTARRDGNTFVGGVIGALAGAAIGANIADDNVREEGAVLGGVVGAAVGASAARNASSRSVAACDDAGYYYTYAQTYPYREPRNAYGRSGQYDSAYYTRQRCRLAVAPAYYNGRTEARYVRVCPDRQGRYRITG